MVQLEVHPAIVKLFKSVHFINAIDIFIRDESFCVTRCGVYRNLVITICVHALKKFPHLFLSILQLAELFIIFVNSPKILYVKVWKNIFLAVESDEWYLKLIFTNELESF